MLLTLVVSLSQGKTQLTVFDANITPHEHKSLFPSSLCLYSLAPAVGASSELKRQFVLSQHKRLFVTLWLCIRSVCVKNDCAHLSAWYGSVCVCVCVCVCV